LRLGKNKNLDWSKFWATPFFDIGPHILQMSPSVECHGFCGLSQIACRLCHQALRRQTGL
jgi:hypothetical protein